MIRTQRAIQHFTVDIGATGRALLGLTLAGAVVAVGLSLLPLGLAAAFVSNRNTE